MLKIKSWKQISKKGKRNYLIVISGLFVCCYFSFTFLANHSDHSKTNTALVDESLSKLGTQNITLRSTQLDVPFIHQLEDIPLVNGCEVTSLAMLLNYYGVDVSKNTLAEQIATVPVEYEDGFKGDPNEGFVGDMSDDLWAMGVFVSPIAELANQYVPTGYAVVASEETNLDDLLEQVAAGQPVWTLVTVDFIPPQNDDYKLWPTRNGDLYLTANIHAAVITGFDETYIYVNDPLDSQNRAVSRKQFEKTFNEMGKQSLYFTPIS